jgi:hypothetical protein
MMEALRIRLEALERAPSLALQRAAVRIQAKLRTDATRRSGKVPSGITASATDSAVDVSAPDWVLRIAEEKGEPDEWADIVAEEVRAAMIGGG